MALINALEESPTEWTTTKENALKDALQDGTATINTEAIQVGGTQIISSSRGITLGATLDASSQDIINIELAEFEQEVDDGNSSTADTIDWGTGNNHKSTLTGNVVYTFTAPSGPARLQLKTIQGVGPYTITWPGTVKWPGGTAPTISTGSAAEDVHTFWYDGTNYYGVSSLDFS